MSMIILLIVMVSISFSSNEENLISNMEEQDPSSDQQVTNTKFIWKYKVHKFNIRGELHKTFFFTKLQILFHVKYCDTAHNFSFCPPSPYESVLNGRMDRVLFNLKFSFKLSLFLCRNWNINQPTVRPVTSRVYKFNIFFYESWRGGRGYEKKSLGCIVNCLLCMGYYVFQRKFYFF